MLGSDAYGRGDGRTRGADRINMAFNGLFVGQNAGAWASHIDSPRHMNASGNDSTASPSSSSGATVVRQRSAHKLETPDALKRAGLSPFKGGKQSGRNRPLGTGYAQRHSQRAALAAAGASATPFVSPSPLKQQTATRRAASPGPCSRQHRRQSHAPSGGLGKPPSPKTDHRHLGTTAAAVIAALAVDAAMPEIDPTARALLEAIMGSSLGTSASLSGSPATLPPQMPPAPAASSHSQHSSSAAASIGRGQQLPSMPPVTGLSTSRASPLSPPCADGASPTLTPPNTMLQRSLPSAAEPAPARAAATPPPWPMPPAALAPPPHTAQVRPSSRFTSPRVVAEGEGQPSQRHRASQEHLQQACKPGSASGSTHYEREFILGASAQQLTEPSAREQHTSIGSAQAPLPELQQSPTPEGSFGQGAPSKHGGDEAQGARRRMGAYASDSDVQLPRRPPNSQSASNIQQAATGSAGAGAAGNGTGTSPGRTLNTRMSRSHAAGSLSTKNLRAMRGPTTYAELQAAAKPQSPVDPSSHHAPGRLPPLPPSDGGVCDEAVPAGITGRKPLATNDEDGVHHASTSANTDPDRSSTSSGTDPAASCKSTRLPSGKGVADRLSNGRASGSAATGAAADMPDVEEEPEVATIPLGVGATGAASGSRRQRQEDVSKRPLLCGLLACFRRGASSPESVVAPDTSRDDLDLPEPLAAEHAEQESALQLSETMPAAVPSVGGAEDSAKMTPALGRVASGRAGEEEEAEPAAASAAVSTPVVQEEPEPGHQDRPAGTPQEQRVHEATKAPEYSPRTPRSPDSVPMRPPLPPTQYQQPAQIGGPLAGRHNDIPSHSAGGGGGSIHHRLSRHASPRSHYSSQSTDGGTQLVRASMDDSLTAVAARQHQLAASRSTSRAGGHAELPGGLSAAALVAAAAPAAAAAAAAACAPPMGSIALPQHRLYGADILRESLLRASAEDSPASSSPQGLTRAPALQPPSRRETGSPRVVTGSLFPPPQYPTVADYHQRGRGTTMGGRSQPQEQLQQERSAADTASVVSVLDAEAVAAAGRRSRKQSSGSSGSSLVAAALLSARKSRKRGRTANPGGTLSQLDARKLAALPLEEMLEQIQAAMYAEDLARGHSGEPAAASAGGAAAAEATPAAAKPSSQGSMRRRRSNAGPRSTAGGSTGSEGAAPAPPKQGGGTGGGRRRRRVKALGRAGSSKRKARAEAAAAAALAAALQHGKQDKSKEAGQPAWRHGGRALAYNGLGIAGTPVSAPLPVPQAISQRGSFDGSFLRQPPYKKTLLSKSSTSPAPTATQRRQHAAEPAATPAMRFGLPAVTPAPRYGQSPPTGTGAGEAAPHRPAQAATSRKPKAAKQPVQHTVITISPVPPAAAPATAPAPAADATAEATTTATPMNTPAPAQRAPVTTSLDLSSLLSCYGGDVGVVVGAAAKSPWGTAVAGTRPDASKAGNSAPSAKAATTALAELVKLMDSGVDSGAIAVAIMSAHAAADRCVSQAPLGKLGLGAVNDQPASVAAQSFASFNLGGMLGPAADYPQLPPLPQRPPLRPGHSRDMEAYPSTAKAAEDRYAFIFGTTPIGAAGYVGKAGLSLPVPSPSPGGELCGKWVHPYSSDGYAPRAGADVGAYMPAMYAPSGFPGLPLAGGKTGARMMSLGGAGRVPGAAAEAARTNSVLAAAAAAAAVPAYDSKAGQPDGVAAGADAGAPSHRRCASAMSSYTEMLHSHQQSTRDGPLSQYAPPVVSRRESTTIGGDFDFRECADDASSYAQDAASSTAYRSSAHPIAGAATGANGRHAGNGCARLAAARQGLTSLLTDAAALGSSRSSNTVGTDPSRCAGPVGLGGGQDLSQRDLLSPSESVPGKAASTVSTDGYTSRSGSSGIVAMAMGERGPLSSPFKATRKARRAEVNPAPPRAAGAGSAAAAAVSASDAAMLTEEDGDGNFRRYTRSGSVTAYDIHAAAAAETPALVYNAALSPRSSTGGESYQPYQPLEELPLRAHKRMSDAARVTSSSASAAASVVSAAAADVPHAPRPPSLSPRQVALPATPRMPDGGNGCDWRCVSLEQYEQSLGDFDAYLAAHSSGSYEDA